MHRRVPEQCQDYMDFQWRNIVFCTFSRLAQLLEQFILRNDQEFWTACLKLTVCWIAHQTFCSIPPALNLGPRPGFYHLWYLLLAKPLPGRLGNHQLFKQCSPAFLEGATWKKKLAQQGKSLDVKLEAWPGLKFCILWWARDTTVSLPFVAQAPHL